MTTKAKPMHDAPQPDVLVSELVSAHESQLNTAREKGALLADRLASVDAALAELDAATPPPVEGGASVLLDDEINARKLGAEKRNELNIERDVIATRLAPVQIEIDRLAKIVADEHLAAQKTKTIADGTAALERVAKARHALDAEIAAFVNVAGTANLRRNPLPELHFAIQAEAEAIGASARKLSVASA